MSVENNETRPVETKLARYIAKSVEDSPFYKFMGISIADMSEGRMVFQIDCEEKHCNAIGLVQGGLLLTLADGAMGNAVRTIGFIGVTIDLSSSFIKPCPFGQLIRAEGTIIKANKSLVYTQARVYSSESLLLAAQGTFFIKAPLNIE